MQHIWRTKVVELCHLEPGDNGSNSVNESFHSPIIISAFIVRIHLSQLNKKATSRNHIQTTSKQSKTKNIASVPFCSSCPMKTSLHSPFCPPFFWQVLIFPQPQPFFCPSNGSTSASQSAWRRSIIAGAAGQQLAGAVGGCRGDSETRLHLGLACCLVRRRTIRVCSENTDHLSTCRFLSRWCHHLTERQNTLSLTWNCYFMWKEKT